MGSSIIYVAILGLWALYLIPLILRRHDELNESRSVDRFSTAMRILSRRTPTTDRRYVVMPKREKSRPVLDDGPRPRKDRARPASRPAPRPVRTAPVSARAAMMARRRRLLTVLMFCTLALGAATPLTPVPWWAPAVGALVLVAFAVHLRVQARRESELRRRHTKVHERVAGRSRRIDSAQRVVEVRKQRDLERLEEQAAEEHAAWLAEQENARLRAEREAEVAGWQPVPMTLPTYVTKPKARPTSRVIDLTKPGRWADEARRTPIVEEPVASPSEGVYDDRAAGFTFAADDAELDSILDRRRAVND